MSRDPVKRARAADRAAYNAARESGVDLAALGEAMAAVLRAREAAPDGDGPPVMRAFPANDVGRWVPIGPSVARRGQAMDRPNVTGRIRDLAVDTLGERAYAATAKGGVWYTRDAGSTWQPVGGWAPYTRTAGGNNNAQACGSILVHFGIIEDLDIVLVGTGELTPGTSATGGRVAGIGVLAAVGPAVVDLGTNPWEADTGLGLLEGLGIYRLVRMPRRDAGSVGANPDVVLACTSDGAYLGTRSNLPASGALPARVGYSWAPTAAFPAGVGLAVTDALWLDLGPPNHRIVAAISGQGLRYTDDSGATSFNIPSLHTPAAAVVGRMSLAHASGNRIYALGETDRARVWQIPDASLAPPVATNCPGLVGTADLWDTQRDYDQAIAVDVDPAGNDRVYVGGAVIDPRPGADWSASLWVYDVGPGPALVTARTLAGRGNPPTNAGADRTNLIGNNMHGDVHAIRLAGPERPNRHVWVGNDGGVYVSVASGRVNTFAARNTGIGAMEAQMVASHPTSAHYLALGCQDNGTQMRRGDTVWELTHLGDGGGVAFHPVHPQIVVAQYLRAQWNSSSRRSYRDPMSRSLGGPPDLAGDTENDASSFYSEAAVFDNRSTGGTGLLAIGTTRVWLNRNLGTAATPSWVVLPHEHLDGAGNPTTAAERDCRGGGVFHAGTGNFGVPRNTLPVAQQLRGVVALSFASASVLVAGYLAGVVLYVEGAAGQWTTTSWAIADGSLPVLAGTWVTDVAAIPGTQDFYVSMTGSASNSNAETLFVYTQATGAFHNTGLRRQLDSPPAIPVGPLDPAFAVVVDPGSPNDVYVGTATGVWKGTRTALPATYTWSVFDNGLPQAVVQDLDIWTGPAPGAGVPRLMRAAVQSRGVWEVDLNAAARRETYLRVHPFDSRRLLPTPLDDPRAAAGRLLEDHASPDIVVRPSWPPATPPPWQWRSPLSRANAPAYAVWTFQTAFRHLYPFVEATGTFTEAFEDALRFHRQRGGRSVSAIIDKGLWEEIVGKLNGATVEGGVRLRELTLAVAFNPVDPATAPLDPADPLAVHCPPWRSALNDRVSAGELDLVERVVPLRDDRGLWTVPRQACVVEVLLHHRDVREIPPVDAQCILYWRTATSVADLMTAPLGDLVAHSDDLFAGNPHVMPAGWNAAPDPIFGMTWTSTDPISARMPRAISVDLDLSAVPADQTHVLLLPVVSSAVDAPRRPAPAGATVRDLVLGWPYAAARVVRLA